MKRRTKLLSVLLTLIMGIAAMGALASCDNDDTVQSSSSSSSSTIGNPDVDNPPDTPPDQDTPTPPIGTAGLVYTLSDDGTYYSITGYTGTASTVTIPNMHNGLSVKSIGGSAFYNCSSLTSITIPDSVTSIGVAAFYYCSNLTSITVSENNTAYKSIDGNLYSKDGTTLIRYAIGKTATTFTIPNSVTSIGDYAFRMCSSLTSVVIGNSVTSIGSYGFYNCSSLTSITIPDNVTSIGDWAFSGCYNLQYNEQGGLKYLGNENNPYLYLAGTTAPTTAVIDNGCKIIGSNAFFGCSSLTSITIPNNVTSIGGSAFYNCCSLTSITIPDSVTSIGSSAFSACSSLTSITVSGNNTAYKSIDGNLYSKNGTTLIQYAIGKTATTFTIPNSVTSIGVAAFSDCSSLTSVVIPDSVTSIGEAVFYNCSSLTSITIPDSVTSIGVAAFYYCSNLTKITVDENNTTYKSIDGNLYSKDGTTLIRYAIGKTATTFTIPNSVTSIGYAAFFHCSSLTSITIPDSVTSIGDYAFRGCSSLTSITIPNSVTSIGYEAFYNCSSLTIYCESTSEPSWWNSDWNVSNCPVVWGYKGEN